ncbi:MAG: phosphatase PAP2 family protein [Ardenticatenaceae bacterium]|nr:phosphatase PAP2 family protein [Ardenticatenaceae bacterium]
MSKPAEEGTHAEQPENDAASSAAFVVKPPPLPLPPALLAKDAIWSQKLAIRGQRRSWRLLAWLLARSGDSVFWVAVCVVALLQRATLGWNLMWTITATAVTVYISKGIYKRERPSGPGRDFGADKYAFPSGHAARVTAVAITLSFLYPLWTAVFLLWATAVALARVVLARHFLTDIAGGAVVGTAVGLLLQLFL